ncbi:MAG: alanine--tRNA ligase, partial [Planctomycetota bacterium]
MPTTAPSLTAAKIRQQYIDYFAQRAGHEYVPSSPVVPHDDPTLLFANAGMNQFKPVFLGQVEPSSPLARLKRAVNSQKCIRAGGKHNDLDDVGRDTYHHTFFEMLGNWSFGDYFKAEAIQWAWELLTEVWGMDPNRLYASYFEGNKELGLEPDREAYDLWTRYLPAERIIPGNMKDNFWEMGDTGPCGPCSELHYDGRPDDERAATPGYQYVNADSEDVVEIWNLVFIQYNRTGPTSLEPLPAKHVDTGMGLERVVRFLQGKRSNYDTDVFSPLFQRISEITGAPAYAADMTSQRDTAYRVIADHARTLTVAITDGCDPSNDGRGYVLRRVLRRAVRYGRQVLGKEEPFLCELVPTVVESLGGAFPELHTNPSRVADVIRDEEEAFGRTLSTGLKLFDEAAAQGGIAASEAFKLHDTYGFPIDLTQQMAEERGLTVDVDGFTRLMDEARELSRTGGREDPTGDLLLPGSAVARLRNLNIKPTNDQAKYTGRQIRATLQAIWNGTDFDQDLIASNTRPDDRFALVFDKTSFYAEQGGQIADTGRISASGAEFIVEDVRHVGGYVVHIGRIQKGTFALSKTCDVRPDPQRRLDIAANHTGTHLLNLALRNTLGDHIDQKGSLVAPDRLRFDFSHSGALTEGEVQRITDVVNTAIEQKLVVYAELAPLTSAKSVNTVRAVFGETYPDPVRVVAIGAPIGELLADPTKDAWMERSVEFCGGTHLESTDQASAFALVAEEAVSKGVRRVVALTRAAATAAIDRGRALLGRAEGAASLPDAHVAAEVSALAAEVDTAEIPLEHKAELRRRVAALQDRAKAEAKREAQAGK